MPSQPQGYFITPNPNKLGFWVRVLMHDITTSNMPVAGVTTWADFKLPTAARLHEDYDDYIYAEPSDGGGESLLFMFLPPGDVDEQTGEPVPFRTKTDFRNHPWPPVLKALNVRIDNTLPRSGIVIEDGKEGSGNAPAFLVDTYLVMGTGEGTLFETEEFFSPTPFEIPQHETPVTALVSYDLPGGVHGEIECLHGGIVLQVGAGELSKVAGSSKTTVLSSVPGREFPPTNFKEWEPYVASDEQNRVSGGYHRVRITVYPPPEPPVIIT